MTALLLTLADASLYLTVFVIAILAIFALFRLENASLKHLALSSACGASLVLSVIPRVEWRVVAGSRMLGGTTISRGQHALAEEAAPLAARSRPQESSGAAENPSDWQTILLAIYLVGAATLAARVVLGCVGLDWASKRSSRLRRGVIKLSGEVVTPMVVGFFRPVIVVPGEWEAWSRFKRRCVVAHEASHIRRRDLALAVLRKITVCVYWFHPLAWWLDRELARLAEYAADEDAARRVRDRIAYGRVLIEVAAARASANSFLPLLAMARPSTVSTRVRRLLKDSGSRPLSTVVLVAIPVMCLGSSVVAAAFPMIPGARSGARLSLSMLWQRQATGKLGAELVVNPVGGQTEELTQAPSEVRSQLPEPVGVADQLWQAVTFTPTRRDLKLIVLEPADNRRPVLYADLNFDGRFKTDERFEFQPTADDPSAWGDVTLHVPLENQPFTRYPIRFRLPRPGDEPFGFRALLRTPFVYVSGTADIGGKAVLVWIQYDPKKSGAFADYGWQGMDINQDGRIQTGSNSPEYTFANDESVIFRVTGRDFSIAHVDLVNKTFALREYSSGANQRITLAKGALVPDFEFRDLDGRGRRFSEFRGKYVLLDFWGTWCGPCIRLLPELQKAHQQFRDRGLVLLGLPSHEEDTKAVRSVLDKHAVTFLQAEPSSVKDLVEKRFRIDAFPTHLMIDPEGRILETGETLRPPNLALLLDRLLPNK